jgi:hypothetical protein
MMANHPIEVQGFVEDFRYGILRGWAAAEQGDQYKQVEIEILIEGAVARTIFADEFRPDLAEHGIGNGFHAFVVDISDVVRNDEQAASVQVRERSTRQPLRRLDADPFALRPTQVKISKKLSDLVIGTSQSQDALISADFDKLAVFATFSADGSLDESHARQVSALIRAGYFVIVVQSCDDGTVSKAFLMDDCFHVKKKNIGYDFGSWWVGLKLISEAQPNRLRSLRALLLMNDSNLGIIADSEVMAVEAVPADLVGLTDSYQVAHHLQSYLLVCKGDYLSSGAFAGQMLSYGFPEAKADVIEQGELELSRTAVQSGYTIRALYEYDSLAETWRANLRAKVAQIKTHFKSYGFSDALADEELRLLFQLARKLEAGLPLNPAHVFWEELIDAGAHFAKRELLFRNPAGIPGAALRIKRLVEEGIVTIDQLNRLASREGIAWRII